MSYVGPSYIKNTGQVQVARYRMTCDLDSVITSTYGTGGALATYDGIPGALTPVVSGSAIADFTVESTSEEDNPVVGFGSGIGIHAIKIYYLSDAGAEKTGTVTLSGTFSVNLPTDVLQLQYVEATTWQGVAQGNLQFKTTFGGSVINLASGRLEWNPGYFQVPTGKRAVVKNIVATANPSDDIMVSVERVSVANAHRGNVIFRGMAPFDVNLETPVPAGQAVAIYYFSKASGNALSVTVDLDVES